MTSKNPFSRHAGHDASDVVRKLIADDPAPTPDDSFWSSVESTIANVDSDGPAAGSGDSTTADDPVAPVTSIIERRSPTRWRKASILTAAAAALLAGLTFSLTQQANEPTTIEVASATQDDATPQPSTDPTPSADPTSSADPTPSADSTLSAEAAASDFPTVEERRESFERLQARLSPEELAALENHGRAATAIYNIDGGLFFSLSDLAPYGDVTQESETERRISCFLDGLREVLTPAELSAPVEIATPLHPAALPAYIDCVPSEEIYERFLSSFLYGHREYSQNQPPIERDEPCLRQVYGTPAEFAASLVGWNQGSRLAVISCVETRIGDASGSSGAGTVGAIVDSPRLTLPASIDGLTPVGYGHVLGLTADRTGLYTRAQAPGSEQTCLESPVSQFYIQPLEGGPRVSAGPHRISGESVTAFASDGTHAIWIEFCEFGESMHVAEVGADGSLANSRLLTSVTGDNRIGSVFRLSITDGVAQASIRPDETVTQDDGVPIILDLVDIDVAEDRVLDRQSFGPRPDVIVTDPTLIRRGTDSFIGLPDGREIALPAGNFGFRVIHDAVADIAYATLRAETPAGWLIVSTNPYDATRFRPVGLEANERPLLVLDDGRSWLIAQDPETGCGSTIVERSDERIDRTVLTSTSFITSLAFVAPANWVAHGFCGDSAVPTQQLGTITADSSGNQVQELLTTVTTHMVIPEWRLATLSFADESFIVESFDANLGSIIVSPDASLSTQGVDPASGWDPLVSAYPLPALFGLYDGWDASPSGVEGAALTLSHESGAVIAVHGTDDYVTGRTADLVYDATADRTIFHRHAFRSLAVTAQVDTYRAEAGAPVTTTVTKFAVGNIEVFVHAEAPESSPEALAAIDEMLDTLLFFDMT